MIHDCLCNCRTFLQTIDACESLGKRIRYCIHADVSHYFCEIFLLNIFTEQKTFKIFQHDKTQLYFCYWIWSWLPTIVQIKMFGKLLALTVVISVISTLADDDDSDENDYFAPFGCLCEGEGTDITPPFLGQNGMHCFFV